jgi:hypothetical protein
MRHAGDVPEAQGALSVVVGRKQSTEEGAKDNAPEKSAG